MTYSSDSVRREAWRVAELRAWTFGHFYQVTSTVVTDSDVGHVLAEARMRYEQQHGSVDAADQLHLHRELLRIIADMRYAETRTASRLWRECAQWTDKVKHIPHPPCAVFDHFVTPDDVSSIVDTD